jgi:hypothetical protein
MKVLKAFNTVNRRFVVGQKLTAADMADLNEYQRGCVGEDEPKTTANKPYISPLSAGKRDSE